MRLAILSVLIAVPALAAPGEEWDITVEVAMPGMPPGSIPPSKTRACGPKRDDSMPFNPAMSQGEGCKILDSKKSGSTWTWKLECEGGVTGTGSITIQSAKAWTGESKMQVEGQNMTSKLSGTLVGPCDYQGPPAGAQAPAPKPAPAPKGKATPKK